MDGLRFVPKRVLILVSLFLFSPELFASTNLTGGSFGGEAVVADRYRPRSNAYDESYDIDTPIEGYDSIIHDLNREVDRPAHLRARNSARPSTDALDNVWFHGGVGFTTMTENLDLDDGSTVNLTMKGVQIAGGIDLFSTHWRTEGTLRNFGETTDQPTHVSLQEFELKLVFHDRLSGQVGFHAGAGLSARYLSIHRPYLSGMKTGGPYTANGDYTTPTSLATGGMDYFLSERISCGLELTARNSLVTETIDRNSLDATIRVDLRL